MTPQYIGKGTLNSKLGDNKIMRRFETEKERFILLMLFLFAIFAVGLGVLNDDDYVLSQDLINAINSDPTSTWTAGINPYFVGKTWKDVKKMMGRNYMERSHNFRSYQRKGITLPKKFDVYEKWENCSHPIRDQGNCGSCWALSSAEAMSDRFCIVGKDVILSPQDLVSCDKMDRGCDGDVHAWDEWVYFEKSGAVTENCFKYVSGSGKVPRCPNKCEDGEVWSQSKHYSKKNSTTHYLTPEDAMEGIFTDGSIQTGFTVYQDFYQYKSGVYSHKNGSALGGHAVKIQGWGVDDNGVKYWNIANSWGPDWGMKGYFWIKRGSDECGIEDELYCGIPDV